MYSPPIVPEDARKFGLKVIEAMDLVMGWGFSKPKDRSRAMQYINQAQPLLIVGSPMCTMLIYLQALARWTKDQERHWRGDRQHLKFMGEVYQKQARAGRCFLHERQVAVSSWGLQEIRQAKELPGVQIATGDQCMYGLKMRGQGGKTWARAKKSTKFMTNGLEIPKDLTQRCDKSRERQRLTGSRAGPSGRCPEGLRRAICMDLMRELRSRDQHVKTLIALDHSMLGVRALEEREDVENNQARDDLTGEGLGADEVRRARSKDVTYIGEKQVWELASRQGAQANVIKTRWIDIDTGDKDSSNCQSRFVAKSFIAGAQGALRVAATIGSDEIVAQRCGHDHGRGQERARRLS